MTKRSHKVSQKLINWFIVWKGRHADGRTHTSAIVTWVMIQGFWIEIRLIGL
jgi:hypothetical protein